MAIFRGTGGAGDATNDITINQVTELTQDAEAAATAAASSATSAASSASSASTSATNAATSATNAATSATNAANSATASASSATTASTAATAAQTAQTAAETAQTAAETAQTAAETAETNAETAETNAVAAQTAAEAAQTAAETAETNAATSATNAATSATNAANSATSASNSATASANSATASASSATDAQTAQTAAEAARDSALASLDSFDDRYLGVKSADPTLDNDGNALVSGALYFNSVDNAMKVYDGSQWLEAYASGEDFLAKANNLSDLPSASTARTNLGLGTAATLDVGTGANNVVQLDGTGALPAVDGSNLTNVSSVANLNDLTDVDTTGVQDGETIVYNSGTSSWEPGTAGGNTAVVGWENQITVAEDYTITTGNNMMSAGPVTIDTGFTVTVPTGSRWVVV